MIHAQTQPPQQVPPIDGPRQAVSDRCARIGLKLTDKRRELIDLLDAMQAPFDMEQVWWAAHHRGQRVNRSTLHRLVVDLVAAGVLNEIGSVDRQRRFAPPLPVDVQVQTPDGRIPVDDATLAEMLARVAASSGLAVGRGRIVISVEP